MNLESSIKDVISKKLEDNTIENLVAEQFEKSVNNALDSLFRSYGDVTKVIETKIKETMIPFLENYDYSEYLVKLDNVLVEVLKGTSLDNKKILSNFKELLKEENRKSIKMSEIFETWSKHVAKHVNTSSLEVEYEDGVSYESVEVTLTVNDGDNPSWSCFERQSILLECEKDEKMNFQLEISRYKKSKEKTWDLSYRNYQDIRSLKTLDSFEIFLMKLAQNGIAIELDIYDETEYVTPDAEPEPSYS